MTPILRTRFAKDIVAEFMPPARPSNKVIIYCPGMPSVPAKDRLLQFYAKRGYWIFAPRYRGTWESSGIFLKISPHQDILDVIDGLGRGFKDLWIGKFYRLKSPTVYVLGSSFGGTAAILVSSDPRVKKIVAIAPVIDWRHQKHYQRKRESLTRLARFIPAAFGRAFNFSPRYWRKLGAANFFNPISQISTLDRKKILIIQARDDKIVPYGPAKKFSRRLKCQLWLLHRGGHAISKKLIEPAFYRRLAKFLRSK